MRLQFYADKFILQGVRDKIYLLPAFVYEGNIRTKWVAKNFSLTIYLFCYYVGFQVRW